MAYTPKKQHDPIDPDVVIPAAIRAASARSDALHREAYQTAAPVAEVTPPAEATPPAAEVKPAEQPKPAEAKPAKDEWEHKYNSIKGRYDQQDETIRGLNSRISELQGLLARAQAPAPVQTPNPDLTFGTITEKDREDFGADFIDVAQRAAAEKLSPEIKRLTQEIERLKGTVGNVAERTAKNAQQALYDHLTEKLPDWRTINRDPKFIAWANLQDPLSGVIRMTMLRNAFDQGDGQRVLRFFQGFLSDEAATAPADFKPDTQKGKVPLESFAAPGRATAPAAATPPGEKETYTNAQIAKFYMDVQKGVFRGNEAEKDRIEKSIFKAQAEGRII